MRAGPPPDPDAEFAEVDPTGRYGRYSEILGKGAFKTVYKAFDELEGIEVAWNQVKVVDVLRNADDLERLYSEVHLLKTLKHNNIIKFYNSWVDTKRDNINFITEVFTSGTLRQYREKHKHVDVRALKNWSRQILSGLDYLHSHNPPVIHRDLKCDNIFVNGNQGEVKIGDLGLAAILRHAHSAHSVIGTPEFMAPELYEEQYNELVDIYAFGMCLLELVTFEYPYTECTNAAQIYKKVTSGIKPASLGKVKDPSVKQFIEKCIANASERLPARELLRDPFLELDLDDESIDHSLEPAIFHADSGGHSDEANSYVREQVEPGMPGRDFTVESQRRDNHTIFLKLRIADSTGQVRNIHFPFDTEVDTPISVANEMVSELDLTDQDVTTIAAMIDAEIQVHVLHWIPGEALEDNHTNAVTVSDDNSEAEDELCALPDDSDRLNGFVLERLPSGRKYWSDSPKGTNTDSPSARTQSNLSSDLNSHDDDDDDDDKDMSSKVYGGTKSGFDDDNRRESSFSTTSSHNQEKDLPPYESIEYNPEHRGSSTPHESSNASPSDVRNHKREELLTCCGVIQSGVVIDQRGDDDSLSKSFSENEKDDVKFIIQKLEHLLVKQQRERDELKRKHDMAIADILKELRPDLRVRTLNKCRLKISDYKVHD